MRIASPKTILYESGAGVGRGPRFPHYALPHPKRYSTKVVASIKTLPKIPEAIAWGRRQQDGKTEVVGISTRPVPDLVQG